MLSMSGIAERGKMLDYVTARGGQINAGTSLFDTNYHFTINADYLEEALNHFSCRFIDPSFQESLIDSEIDVIDSEHASYLQDDYSRRRHILGQLTTPMHPVHRFHTGSKQTLAGSNDMCQQIIIFFNNHYSAHQMKLVVMGKETLDVLESWVQSKFSAIVNRSQHKQLEFGGGDSNNDDINNKNDVNEFHGGDDTSKPMFSPKFLPAQVTLPTASQTPQLMISWMLPPSCCDNRKKSDQFLAHLVQHKSETSIFMHLTRQGWITELVGHCEKYYDHFHFEMVILLTSTGAKNIQAILEVIYAYFAMLMKQSTASLKTQYDQLSRQQEVDFTYRSKRISINWLMKLALNMQTFPIADILYGPRHYAEFDHAQILQCLSHLRADNMLLTMQLTDLTWSQTMTEDLKMDPYYNLPYKVEPLTPSILASLNTIYHMNHDQFQTSPYSHLSIPPLNMFSPDDLTLKPCLESTTHQQLPEMIMDTSRIRVWHKQDHVFNLPHVCIYLTFQSPHANNNALEATKLYVLVELFHLFSMTYSQDAINAGITSTLFGRDECLNLQISGYHCKIPMLIDYYLTMMSTFKTDELKLCSVVDILKQQWENEEQEAPSIVLSTRANSILNDRTWLPGDLLAHLNNITPTDIDQFLSLFLQDAYLEMLCMGNLTKEDACQIAQNVLVIWNPNHMHTPPLPSRSVRTLCMPPKSEYVYASRSLNPEDVNSGLYNWYAMGEDSMRDRVKIVLWDQLVSTFVFNVFREEEINCYISSSGYHWDGNMVWWNVMLQSDKVDPILLDERLEALGARLADHIHQMTSEVFDQHCKTVKESYLTTFKTLNEEADYYWQYIEAPADYDFDGCNAHAQIASTINKQEMIDFWNTYGAPNAPKRRKLSCQSWTCHSSIHHPHPSAVLILDETHAIQKANLIYYPEIASKIPRVM